MSGDKNRPDPYQDEREDATSQNGALDAVMTMTRVVNPFNPLSPFPNARGIHFASTDFEGYDLNDMVDIVESANPELLESAGEALLAARTAIEEAADILDGDLKNIDWKGEAHDAFQKWAKSLVTTAKGLANYAETVGTQVMAAGSGLASVRKSMPPRDSRANPKTVDDIPPIQRLDTNEEFTAARKAEQNRQEAINQMYRLASFYRVSQGKMASAEEPVFPKMPDVGVPEPLPYERLPTPPASEQMLPASSHDARTTAQSERGAEPGRQSVDAQALLKEATKPDGLPKPAVGTEINTVGTLPPQEAVRPPTAGAPPMTAGPVGQPGPVPPMAPSTMPPVLRGTAGRSLGGPGGLPGGKVPPVAHGPAGGPGRNGTIGRMGPGAMGTGSGPVAGGAGPMGRATGPLGPVGRGAMPGQASGAGSGTAGRGIVGGVPRATTPMPGPVGGGARGPMGPMGPPLAGRSGTSGRRGDGVVGGRPVVGAPQSGAGTTPRLPRGNVIGGEGAAAGGSTGQRPGQQGVIGAPPTTANRAPSGRRPAGSSEGVIGAPTATGAASRKSGRSSEEPGARHGASKSRNAGSGRSRREGRRDDTSASG
ncbi:hypothetical protein [Streptomyces sp. NPDC029526]|uniref:hypothetical protein n=1 Tax=Streptomyces sp. NPDC029526 TaxID=3155728 RepID=UPI0033E7F786